MNGVTHLALVAMLAGGGLLSVPLFAGPAPAKKTVKKKRPVRKPAPISAKARAAAKEYVNARVDPAIPPQIENAAALIPFFEQLFRLDNRLSSNSVRILHYGDSHTAADEWTGRLRSQFQSRFGDGGAGFSLAGRPFRSYRHRGQRSSMTGGWNPVGLLDRDGDSMYGLGGAAVETARAGEVVSLDAEARQVEVFFLRQPGGGWVQILEEGRPVEAFSTDGPLGTGYFRFDATSTHFEVETLDNNPVRLFGWTLDNPGGVTWETLGLNGAQASIFGQWHADLWSSQLAYRDPALIVLAYGTNEASNSGWSAESYAAAFGALVARIRQSAPAASILVLGPPDRLHRVRRGGWTEFARMNSIVAAQRAAALDNKCAFWDWRGRMGGEGAMRRWVVAGYAQRDHVHFTTPGYHLTGEAVYRDILTEYGRFVKVRERVFEQETNGQTSEPE